MSLVVQKYGGSSLAKADRIKAVAHSIAETKAMGKDVVVTVSAMGDSTDHLVELALEIDPSPDLRELDLLLSTGEIVSCTLTAMALRAIGCDAISLTGGQAGIKTDSSFSQAKIVSVNTQRITKELEQGKVVIVAGFQGVTEEDNITTLGRGASDTTAVALAAALRAERCEIFTDVEGIYTADPRVVPEAKKLSEIGYEEMLELASYGAKMHPRSIEIGAVYNIPIMVASSFDKAPGTLIHGGASMETRNKVTGIAHDGNVAKITILGVPDQPGIASSIFTPLAREGISVDTIVQNASVERITDLTFTVAHSALARAMKVVEPISLSNGAKGCKSNSNMGKVSIVGSGMQNSPGYAALMFQALHEAGINIEMITTSEIRITCIVDRDKLENAVRALHRTFELEKNN
jgi:aspartate kinase